MKSNRLFYLAILLTTGALLGYGYYLQFVQGLEPCPLCIFQRLAYLGIALLAMVGLIHAPGLVWGRIYDGMILIGAITGAIIAGRQVWLQHLPPDQVPECGPGLDFMLQVFPLTDTIRMVFTGSGECAKVDWTFLSFSIAEWSLAWFCLFAIIALCHMVKPSFPYLGTRAHPREG